MKIFQSIISLFIIIVSYNYIDTSFSFDFELFTPLFGLPLDAAATLRLDSLELSLNKHYIAIKINNEIKTKSTKT